MTKIKCWKDEKDNLCFIMVSFEKALENRDESMGNLFILLMETKIILKKLLDNGSTIQIRKEREALDLIQRIDKAIGLKKEYE